MRNDRRCISFPGPQIHPAGGRGIIPQVEPLFAQRLYTLGRSRPSLFGRKGDVPMIVIIIPLLLFFAVGSISPLLVSDDTEQIVGLES